MQEGLILDVDSVPDDGRGDIPANDGVKPDAAFFPDCYIPGNDGKISEKSSGIYLGFFIVIWVYFIHGSLQLVI